jgi:uncharacterized membrane protein YphA (DoxX/SURF4 family)
MDKPNSKWQVCLGHGAAVLVAVGLIPAGLVKLVGVEEVVQNFARWGFPWFWIYVTGLLELTASVLVLVPRTRLWGAALAVLVMLSATAVHLMNGEAGQIGPTLAIAAMAAVAGWSARPTR